MSTEELTEIKKFNKNIEWLKKQSIVKKEQWVNVTELMSHTKNLDKDKLRRLRDTNRIEFKDNGTGGWLYNLNSVPAIYLNN